MKKLIIALIILVLVPGIASAWQTTESETRIVAVNVSSDKVEVVTVQEFGWSADLKKQQPDKLVKNVYSVVRGKLVLSQVVVGEVMPEEYADNLTFSFPLPQKTD